MISWAVPGQGGHHHVNNQDESYVVPTVEKFGFAIDRGVTARLREVMLESTVAAWFRKSPLRSGLETPLFFSLPSLLSSVRNVKWGERETTEVRNVE